MALQPHLGYANRRPSASVFRMITWFIFEGTAHGEMELKTRGEFSGFEVSHMSRQWQDGFAKQALCQELKRQMASQVTGFCDRHFDTASESR